MPGDFIRRLPQLTFEQFDAFREERPKEEKWELIEGVPMMMPPPTLVHQTICGNIEDLINARLRVSRPEWRALQEIGIRLPDDDRYNPEPDVTVIEPASVQIDQVYAERFYFVAEVLSNSNRPELRAGSDKPIVLATKVKYYKLHEHCRGVLVVRQDQVSAELNTRGPAWAKTDHSEPAGRIVIPDIGDIGPLAALYRHTPLWQSAWSAL
jgi:Uma2 family endonuclease